MAIDKSTAQTIGREVEEALKAIAERHGLTVVVRGGSYDSGSFRPKVEFKTGDADAAEFRRYASVVGLEPDDFGKTFKSGGNEFRITGISLRSPKRPIIVADVKTGRGYKFSEVPVVAALHPERKS